MSKSKLSMSSFDIDIKFKDKEEAIRDAKRKEITIKYIEDLICWLKMLTTKQQEQFIKKLHCKLSQYEVSTELTF